MTDRKITGIKSILVGANTEYNIMDVDIWLVTDEGSEDLAEVQFLAGTIEGVGFKQWAKGWLVKVVHDGFTDVWDSYIDDDGKGIVLPAFAVTFDTVVAGVIGTMICTFQVSTAYISNRDDLHFERDQKRTPGAIYVLCTGIVSITHT